MVTNWIHDVTEEKFRRQPVRIGGPSEILVTSDFTWWVLRIRYQNRAGTGFLVNIGGETLLVTARHVVEGMQTGDRLGVRRSADWDLHPVTGTAFPKHGEDVAVVRTPFAHAGGIAGDALDAGGILLGQRVVYLGFPLGLEMDAGPDKKGFPHPLLKSGLFSGAIELPGHSACLFETTNNVGFSGGPILVREGLTGAVKLWGVVSAYEFDEPTQIRFKDENEIERAHHAFYVKPNSGFMRGYGFNTVLEAAANLPPRR